MDACNGAKHVEGKWKLPVLGANPETWRFPAGWEEIVVPFNLRRHWWLLELRERKGQSQQQGQIGNWSSDLVLHTLVFLVFVIFRGFFLVFSFPVILKKHPTLLWWLQMASNFWENLGKIRGSWQHHCHGQWSFLVPLHTQKRQCGQSRGERAI